MNNLLQVLKFFGGIPTFFILFIILLFMIHYHMQKASRNEKKSRNEFWEKEANSLFVRKKEIPSDLYIQLNKASIPNISRGEYESHDKHFLYKIQTALHDATNDRMLNLSDLLNSEIRLQFGTANLPLIEQYEDSYLNCITNIYKLSNELYELNYTLEALRLLEEGVRIGTDIRAHYMIIAKIYLEIGKTYLLDELIVTLKEHNCEKYVKIIDALIDFKANTIDHVDL